MTSSICPRLSSIENYVNMFTSNSIDYFNGMEVQSYRRSWALVTQEQRVSYAMEYISNVKI